MLVVFLHSGCLGKTTSAGKFITPDSGTGKVCWGSSSAPQRTEFDVFIHYVSMKSRCCLAGTGPYLCQNGLSRKLPTGSEAALLIWFMFAESCWLSSQSFIPNQYGQSLGSGAAQEMQEFCVDLQKSMGCVVDKGEQFPCPELLRPHVFSSQWKTPVYLLWLLQNSLIQVESAAQNHSVSKEIWFSVPK